MFTGLLKAVLDSLDVVWQWFRKFSFALFNRNGELYSLLIPLCIAISISVLFVAIKIIRSFTWGS